MKLQSKATLRFAPEDLRRLAEESRPVKLTRLPAYALAGFALGLIVVAAIRALQ